MKGRGRDETQNAYFDGRWKRETCDCFEIGTIRGIGQLSLQICVGRKKSEWVVISLVMPSQSSRCTRQLGQATLSHKMCATLSSTECCGARPFVRMINFCRTNTFSVRAMLRFRE